jgi:hypothetical protein
MRTAALARVCGSASRNEKALSHLPRPLGGHRDLRPSVRISAQVEAATIQCIKKAPATGFESRWTLAVRHVEAAGVVFIDENGGGPGVRLRERLSRGESERSKSDRGRAIFEN